MKQILYTFSMWWLLRCQILKNRTQNLEFRNMFTCLSLMQIMHLSQHWFSVVSVRFSSKWPHASTSVGFAPCRAGTIVSVWYSRRFTEARYQFVVCMPSPGRQRHYVPVAAERPKSCVCQIRFPPLLFTLSPPSLSPPVPPLPFSLPLLLAFS